MGLGRRSCTQDPQLSKGPSSGPGWDERDTLRELMPLKPSSGAGPRVRARQHRALASPVPYGHPGMFQRSWGHFLPSQGQAFDVFRSLVAYGAEKHIEPGKQQGGRVLEWGSG